MARKKRGLFHVDTGEHSPELTAFLRAWLRPGHLPGQSGDGSPPPFKRKDLHPDPSASYRTLSKVLCTSAIAIAALSWVPGPMRASAGTVVILRGIATVLAVLGVSAFIGSRRSR